MLSVVTATIFMLLLISPVSSDDEAGNGSQAAVDRYGQAIERLQNQTVDAQARWRKELEGLIRGGQTAPLSLPGSPGGVNRPPTSRLLVFVSLSMPEVALKGWLEQTGRAGGTVVLRGFHENKLSATLRRIRQVMPDAEQPTGLSIDPTAFRRLDVKAVPTVVVLGEGMSVCKTPGCEGVAAPVHDRIAGNTTLQAALKRLVTEGDAAPEQARLYLSRLTGGQQ